MAGHSKWKNIQHRKGAQDKKRGKIFTKMGREITIASKLGGEDPEANPRLRLAITKARAGNMPRDNITRAIKKGSGKLDMGEYVEKVYEGYGPGGVAIIIECLTENINRTVSEVRYILSRNGGSMGAEGSVAWMFNKKGLIIYEKEKIPDFDAFFEAALEAGVEDVNDQDEDIVEVTCEWQKFSDVKDALDKLNIEAAMAEISQIPENKKQIDDDAQSTLDKLVDKLDDLDDVQSIFHNAEN